LTRKCSSEFYRLQARQCVEIAHQSAADAKLALLNMAQAWLALADQSDRNSKSELVYETPEPQQHVVQQQQQQPQPDDKAE
jgi:hypothetical protein